MINTNELILDELKDSEYFLLSIFASYGRISHPANKVLVSRTKWDKKKVKRHEEGLIKKGFLVVSPRYQIIDGQTRKASNKYEITTDLIGKFNGKKKEPEITNTEIDDLKKQIEDLKKQIARFEKIGPVEPIAPPESETEKPKRKAAKRESKPKIEDLEFQDDFDDELKGLLVDFIEYKAKEKKQHYKNVKSLQRVANAFYKGAKSYGIIAVKIALDSTKLNQYAGIFIKKPSKQELEQYGKQETNSINHEGTKSSKSLQDELSDYLNGAKSTDKTSECDSGNIQEFG